MAKTKNPWALVVNVSDLTEERIQDLWDKASQQGLLQLTFPPYGTEGIDDPGSWLIANESLHKEIWVVQQPDDKVFDSTTQEGRTKMTRRRKLDRLLKAAKRLRIKVKNITFNE